MDRKRRCPWGVAVVAAGLFGTGPMYADDVPAEEAPPAAVADDATTVAEEDPVLPALQPGDEPTMRLRPLVERTADDQRRLDALAHFMAGQLYLQRGDVKFADKALAELSQSVELNPHSIEAYRLLVPLAVREGDDAAARKYGILATLNTRDGVQLLRALVAVYVQQGQIDTATSILREALAADALRDSNEFRALILRRHLGQCLHMGGKQAEAAAEFQNLLARLQANAVEIAPDESTQLFGEKHELYEEMGTAFLDAELPELAVQAFDEAARRQSLAPGLHGYNLAQVFRKTGNPERALQELDSYLSAQLVDKGRAPYQLLKELLTDLSRADELLPRLEALLEHDAHNKFLGFFVASEYVARERLDEALALYQQFGSNDPEALLGLASIYRRQGKYDEWLTTAGRAFAVLQIGNQGVLRQMSADYQDLAARFVVDFEDLAGNAEQLAAVVQLARDKSTGNDPSLEFEEAWLMGKVAVAGGRSDDAMHFYNYAIGTQNLPSYSLYQELGAHLFEVKRYTDAEVTFQQAADHPSLDLARPFFLSLVSLCRESDGRIEPAIEAIQQARELAPEDSRYAIQEGRIYYRARRWDEAIRLFESVVREYADDAETVLDTKFSLSACYVQQEQYEEGERILLEILAENPNHPQANNDLGYLWADRNQNLERAREMLNKAIAAEPENPAYQDSMGWVLYRLGEYDAALKHLETAAADELGQDGVILDHLGDILFKLGRTDEARAKWQEALKNETGKPFPDPKLVKSLESKLAPAP